MAAKKKRVASRNDQVVRILHLLRDLERLGGCDLYELAIHYGTTTRTIRRDLEALEEACFMTWQGTTSFRAPRGPHIFTHLRALARVRLCVQVGCPDGDRRRLGS